MPVAPYTTVSVPGSRPPPSIASSFGSPVETRAVMGGDSTLPVPWSRTGARRVPRAIRRALLDLIVRDLNNDLEPDAHNIAIIHHRDLPKTQNHNGELSIGE